MIPEWKTSCVDWADRLMSGRSIIPPPIFPEEAEAALLVMRDLRIVDAPGSPRMGDACGDWIFELAAAIFGSYDCNSGKRLIREFFIMLPKKNFKSGFAATVMLTMLIRNWRNSAEFTIIAPTIEVAGNSFDPAKDMVSYKDDEEDSDLSDLINVQTHIRTLTHLEKGAKLKIISADPDSTAGKKSVGTLIEELWLFGKNPKAKDMFREALGGLASRPEGFVIYLTTQSDDPPAGIFKEKLQYARDVRDGVIHDPEFLPVIYEYPPQIVEKKQHMDVKYMSMVNPNMGYSVSSDFLEREFRKAKSEGEASLNGFLAKHANVEVGLALRSDRWAGADFWLACTDKSITLDSLIARSEVIAIGIDGGGLDDLLGLSVVGRDENTKQWIAWCHAWAHPSVLERRQEVAPRLLDFQAEGSLTIVDTIGEDVDQVADIVEMVYRSTLLDKIGVDQHGIGSILNELESRGVPKDLFIAIPQGWKMIGAINTTERKLAEKGKSLIHDGSTLMNWCVGNARIQPAGNAVYITKQVSGKAKIDPLMAMINAISLMLLNPKSKKGSIVLAVAG